MQVEWRTPRTTTVGLPPLEAERWPAGPGLAASLWMHKGLILTGMVVGLLVGFGGARLQVEAYEASGYLVITDPNAVNRLIDEPGGRINAERNLRNRMEQVASARVIVEAAERLGAWSASDLEDAVAVSGTGTTDIITITARAPDPQDAAAAVNAVGEAYIAISAEDARVRATERLREVEAAAERVEQRLAVATAELVDTPGDPVLRAQQAAAARELIDLSSRAERLAVASDLPPTGVSGFNPALAPRQPITSGPRRTAALGAMAGLAVAGAVAWARAGSGARVRSGVTASELLGAPLLGSVPVLRRRAMRRLRDEEELYQLITASILAAVEGRSGPTVAFATARPGAGGTHITQRVARVASAMRAVVMVDGDIVGRSLTRAYGLEGKAGFAELARRRVEPELAEHVVDVSAGRDLSLIPVGGQAGTVGGLLGGARLGDALAQLGARGEDATYLIDCGAALALSDALDLAGDADGIVIVVRERVPAGDLEELRERLRFGRSQVIGVVFNGGRGWHRRWRP